MFKFLPFVLMLGYGLLLYRFSVWRSSKELDAKSTPLIDPVLGPLTARLAAAIGVPHIQVHLYNITPVNGLAAPDGRIFLTRGFYAKFQSGEVTGEEIASVIAHELGHVALGHSKRRMIDFSGRNRFSTVASAMRMAF